MATHDNIDRSAEIGAKPGAPEGDAGRAMLNRMNRTHAPLREFAFSHIEFKPDMQILDVGCGGGATVHDLLEKSPGSRVDGLDYMADSIALASEYNKEYLGTRANFYQGDVHELQFDDNRYDLITGVETVYFWADVQKAFKGLHRVLKEGGKLAVILEASDPDNLDWGKVEGTFRVYRPWELEEYMDRAGFKEVHLYHGLEQAILVVGVK